MKYQGKYHAKKVVVDGIKFDSSAEGMRYRELKYEERKGHIKNLQRQINFTVMEGYKNGQGEVIRPIKYRADFVYTRITDDGEEEYVVEDVKGYKTPEYKLKKKLFEKAFYPLCITETH